MNKKPKRLSRRDFFLGAGFALTVASTVLALSPSRGSEDWKLSPEQRETLTMKAFYTPEADKFSFTIVAAPGRPEAVVMAYDIFNVFFDQSGWPVSVLPFDAEHSPQTVGVKIATALGEITTWTSGEPKPKSMRIFDLLLAAKIPFSLTTDRRLKGDEVAIIVGRRP